MPITSADGKGAPRASGAQRWIRIRCKQAGKRGGTRSSETETPYGFRTSRLLKQKCGLRPVRTNWDGGVLLLFASFFFSAIPSLCHSRALLDNSASTSRSPVSYTHLRAHET